MKSQLLAISIQVLIAERIRWTPQNTKFEKLCNFVIGMIPTVFIRSVQTGGGDIRHIIDEGQWVAAFPVHGN